MGVRHFISRVATTFLINFSFTYFCVSQEIDIQVNRKGNAKLTVSWSVVENNSKFLLQYADKINSTQWKNIESGFSYEKSWPVSKKEYSINLNFDQPERYYRLKMEDSISPHQLKWFATKLESNPLNSNYPDPELDLSYDDNYIIIESNDIPTFEFVSTTPNALRAQDFRWEIPRFPSPAIETTQIPLLGTVAITTSGMPIYGPNEAQHPDPFGDPYINGILDFCHGHTGGQGDYHFHFAPTCMIEAPDGVEEHYNIIGFALDGYPIIAHYKSLPNKEGAEAFDWQETTGFEPDSDYKASVIDNGQVSEYAWDNHKYNENRPNSTLDECNGRELGIKILSDGTKFNEKAFFNFDYAYFATAEFPYLMAKYKGTPNSAGDTGVPGGGNPNDGGQTGGGEDIITNVNPSDGLSGDTLTLNISLNGNTRPPLPPQQIQPRSVSVGTIDLNNLTRPSRTTIRGTLKIPKNAQKGTKGITIIFPGPPGVNNVTFNGEDKFEIK